MSLSLKYINILEKKHYDAYPSPIILFNYRLALVKHLTGAWKSVVIIECYWSFRNQHL